VISTFNRVASFRARRLVVGLLLLVLPACGTSVYEERMRETQKRYDLFLEEQKYLDAPVQMPKRKVQSETDKEPREEDVANVFFRPPKGIKAVPEAGSGLLWRYLSQPNNDFTRVEMAFAEGNKDFAREVLNALASAKLSGPQSHASLPFYAYEGSDAQNGYSVNILNLENARTQVAIVYVFPKERSRNLGKAIDASLGSLAVDRDQITAARRRYTNKSPWRLQRTAKNLSGGR
jgi:hypothetical protein